VSPDVRDHAIVPGTEIVDELGITSSRDEIAIGVGHEWASARSDGVDCTGGGLRFAWGRAGCAQGKPWPVARVSNDNDVRFEGRLRVAGCGSVGADGLPATGDREDAESHVERSTTARDEGT
jgi:hypothetical protein